MTTDTTCEAPAIEQVRAGSRRDRLSQPRARDVLRETAIEFGVCVRPVLLRRTDTVTGVTDVIEVACGSTRAAVCPPCADKARRLRAQQCREGWHLSEEPDITPHPATPGQRDLMAEAAALTDAMTTARDEGNEELAAVCADALAEVNADLAAARVRGGLNDAKRRVRSTRRRDDVPDLPRRPSTGSTLGRTFTDPASGKTFRPSMFVTLTLPSYGRVHDDGTPVHPGTYDYRRAARDALHFGKLLDRFHQNLRRVAGYDVQYFAAVEPQRRAAPHAHYAIRGTLPRAVVKQVVAATYVNVWWPHTDSVVYDGDRLPIWCPASGTGDDPDTDEQGGYVDPDTGQPLPTWAEALDALDAQADADGTTVEPLHTVRFGTQADVQGLLAGSPKAERAIGYLVKYLVKDLGEDLEPTDPDTPTVRPVSTRRADHIAHLVEALRFEPCSPRCANWLRYGIQPAHPRSRMRPGCCRAKAHRPSHLGYGGRRILVSRKWTAKDLTDHRHDRRAHVLAILGHDPNGDGSEQDSATHIAWELARPTDPDVPGAQHRLLRRIAHAVQQRTAYHHARDGTGGAAQEQVSFIDAASAA